MAGIFFIENSEIKYGWGFISLAMLKQDPAGNFFHLEF